MADFFLCDFDFVWLLVGVYGGVGKICDAVRAVWGGGSRLLGGVEV